MTSFLTWTTTLKASSQPSFGNCRHFSLQRTRPHRVRCLCSATPFWCGVCDTVELLTMRRSAKGTSISRQICSARLQNLKFFRLTLSWCCIILCRYFGKCQYLYFLWWCTRNNILKGRWNALQNSWKHRVPNLVLMKHHFNLAANFL